MNIDKINSQFPILKRQVNGKRLVYLDNAATTQKPRRVIDALSNFYTQHNANIHRGLHTLSTEATDLYEKAHEEAARFIKARGSAEVIFTRNTTESINLVAQSWGRKFLKKGDIVVVTEMEHHSNIVPWQMLAMERGIQVKWIPVLGDGTVDLKAYEAILKKHGKKVKLVSIVHVSNVLGTVNPVKEVFALAHGAGAVTLLDAAQSVSRLPLDVAEIGADFLAFSSHKMYGPTGIGVLYGRRELLEEMEPWMGGGDMITRVNKEVFEPAVLPWKFEAGTPNIADGAVFAEAMRFIDEAGFDNILKHERDLVQYALDKLLEVDGVKILGSVDARNRLGSIAFNFDGIHPHDLASLLDEDGVAIRAGQHCAMPLHIKFGVKASARISFGVYNTREDIDIFINSLKNAKRKFI